MPPTSGSSVESTKSSLVRRVKIGSSEIANGAGIFHNIRRSFVVGVEVIARRSELDSNPVREVAGLQVGHPSGWDVVRGHVNLVRHLERSTSCLPRMRLKVTLV